MEGENVDEQLQILQIFPNEVWGIVLENVKEVEDYYKICDASPQIRARLLRRAPLILFPDVAKAFLIKNGYKNHLSQLVHMRQVCSTWKQEVDKLLQETPDYFLQLDDEPLYDMSGIAFLDNENKVGLYNPFRFWSVQRFAKFEEHFDPTHLASGANPFVHRKIDLYIDDDTALPENNYAASTRFLEKYGKHLWFCIIHYEFQDRNNQIDFYNRRVATLLERMPNLQALQIELLRNREDGDDMEDEAAPMPFPTLPRLEYISIDNCCPCAVVEELVERNPQVRYVDAARSNWMPVFLQFLPNLRAATFAIITGDSLEDIDGADFTNSQLERLWLRLILLGNKVGLEFQKLERYFAESLVKFHLNLSDYSNIAVGDRLMLPHLKIFHMEMDEPTRLEFLLPMKETLEELHLATEEKPSVLNWRFEIPEPGQDEVKLQVYKFWKEPKKSNIWSFFRKLRVLEIKWFREEGETPEKYRCTRKEWEAEMGAEGK